LELEIEIGVIRSVIINGIIGIGIGIIKNWNNWYWNENDLN
jgi:hypothetical protein